MHVDAAGNVNARLTVERSETLDMFQRDQRSLERALAQAGLDSARPVSNSPSSRTRSNLSGQGSRASSRSFGNSNFALSRLAAAEDEPAVPAITLYRGLASAGGVNLFV